MGRVQMNQCCHLHVKCANFNITVSLMETLFCQKFSNQLYSQQQLIKMPALALKAVPLAQGSLASQPANNLLRLRGAAAAAASIWGYGQVSPASPSGGTCSHCTAACGILSFPPALPPGSYVSPPVVSHSKLSVVLFQAEQQTMASKGFRSHPTAQVLSG